MTEALVGRDIPAVLRAGLLVARIRLRLAESYSDEVDVVFFPRRPADAAPVAEALHDLYQSALAPGAIIFFGWEPHRPDIDAVAADAAVLDQLPRRMTRFGLAKTPLVLTIDAEGHADFAEDPRVADVFEVPRDDVVAEIVAEGLRQVFRENLGFITEDDRVHYKTPGGTHQATFIRTGMAFLQEPSAAFAAATIWMRLSGRTFDQILTDTSTVAALAYSYANIQAEFHGKKKRPLIGTFGGHAAVSGLSFTPSTAPTLYLVSNSVTQALPIALSRRIADSPDSRIVTVVYAGIKEPASSLIVMIEAGTRHGENPHGIIPSIVAHPPSDCDLCAAGSIVVEIIGDQLVPATPAIVGRRIFQGDAPEWLQEWGRYLFGRRLIRAHQVDDSSVDNVTRSLYVDLSSSIAAAEEGPLMALLTEELRHAAQERPELVVRMGDPASAAVAQLWQRDFAGAAADPPMTNYAELLRRRQPYDVDSVLVLASTASSGRTLVDISRALRELAPRALIRYVVVLARAESRDRWEDVVNNLTWRGKGQPKHQLNALMSISLPNDRSIAESPWSREQRVWNAQVSRLRASTSYDGGDAEAVIEKIEARLGLLDTGGLIDDLFLPRAGIELLIADDEHRLGLTEGFVYLPSDVPYTTLSQADVFAVVAAVLHRARTNPLVRSEGGRTHAEPLLQQNGHNRVVISPFTFNRFSDGILHAALLRAAHPGELDYSSDAELSRDVKSVLIAMFSRRAMQGGSATPEFLLAIAMRRLVLQPQDARIALDLLERELVDAPDSILSCLLEMARAGVDSLH